MTVKWKRSIERSGYFFGAVLLHLVLFVLIATLVVFRAPATHLDATFVATRPPSVPPPPPTPPSASGAPSMNSLEPDLQTTPPVSVPSVISSLNANAFTVKAAKLVLPNLPASMTAPTGTSLDVVHGTSGTGSTSGSSNPFGSTTSSSSDENKLTGYLIDLKQTSARKPTDMDTAKFHQIITNFIEGNWDPGILKPYYQSARPLYATSIFIPNMLAVAGPKAFGVDNEVQPRMWVVWYKASVTAPSGGTYRFAGFCDDILAVRVNGKTVLDGSIRAVTKLKRDKFYTYDWAEPIQHSGYGHIFVGEPFHVDAAQKVDIDVLIGEEPGGSFNAFLYIMKDDGTYEKRPDGQPILPAFQLNDSPIPSTGMHPPVAAGSEVW